MTTIHAIWHHATLHLWGERDAEGVRKTGETDTSRDAVKGKLWLSPDELRQVLGDVRDSLLVSGATNAALDLELPAYNGAVLSSMGSADVAARHGALASLPCRIATLKFSPADAMDLLTATPPLIGHVVEAGDSLRYWGRVGRLVLRLLAKQQFVPAVHAHHDGRHFGFWRAVLDDEEIAATTHAIIHLMPPICRAVVSEDGQNDGTDLVEDFLWRCVDAMVRRYLEGDELAQVLHEKAQEDDAPQVRWLRSLVHADPTLVGTPEDCRAIRETVDKWLATLSAAAQTGGFKTCLKLTCEVDGDTDQTEIEPQTRWILTLLAQSNEDPEVLIDAAELQRESSAPSILENPFANATEQIRMDAARAARHFPPLDPCAQEGGPTQIVLDLEQAYHFLRDAAPILQAESFGVQVPNWWHRERPRLRTRLNVRPTEGQGATMGASLGLEALVEYDWSLALDDHDLSLEEISKLAEAKAPLVCVRGRWAELPTSELRTALKFLERNPGGRMTIFQALRMSYTADDLDTGLPVAGLRAQGWIKNLLNATIGNDQVEQPDTFLGALRPYQMQGLRWLSFLSRHGLGACLADDMGLGKTIQLIALLLHEREAGRHVTPTLLVVPMSLVGNWERELGRFAPSLRVLVHHGLDRLTGDAFHEEAEACDVVISTYGLTHRDKEHLERVEWHRIALDEAQNIKNPAAKQAVAVRKLKAVNRVALTGTPVENRLSELWSIMDFLNPGYLGPASEFRKRFAVPIERYRDEDRGERLRHLIRPFVLRRLKDDPTVAVDLPEKMEMTVYCNLTREQAALYEATVSEMLRQIEVSGGIQRRGLILATLVKLKQICNHPTQFLADGGQLAQRSGKFDRITEMLDEVLAEKHRALVFTQFRRMGELLHRHMREIFGDTVLFMHGGTTQKSRVEMIDRFQAETEDARIFLLSLKTGGVGLNLTAANHVFHFDRWWNPAVEDQATDRAHRIGQHKTVQVHKFVCIGTLEERIDAVSEEKRVLARNVIGSGDDWITELSTDALRDLFALSHEAVAES